MDATRNNLASLEVGFILEVVVSFVFILNPKREWYVVPYASKVAANPVDATIQSLTPSF